MDINCISARGWSDMSEPANCRHSFTLWEIWRVTDCETSSSAYYAYALSIISYGIILRGNCPDNEDILTLHKKCIRILTNANQIESCKSLFVEYGILILRSIYFYLCHSIIIRQYIFESCKFVRKHNNPYTVITSLKRKNRNLHKWETVTSSFKSLLVTIKLYDNLPTNIRNIVKDTEFENTLKPLLIKEAITT